MFSYQSNSCFTLISLLPIIREGTHLTFGLVFGDMVIMLNPGFATLSWSQSTRICLPGHLQSLLVFLMMVGYDIAPQRQGSHSTALICRY